MLDGIGKNRHVWPTVMLIDVLIPGKTETTQPEPPLYGFFHKSGLDGAPTGV
jgi:hypothetical protein